MVELVNSLLPPGAESAGMMNFGAAAWYFLCSAKDPKQMKTLPCSIENSEGSL
jgi:hypothetical protein